MRKNILILGMYAVFLAGSIPVLSSTGPKDGDDSSQQPTFPKQTFGNIVCREQTIQYMRPTNQCGINMFETPETTDVPFTGFRVNWGAGFTQEFQSLKHRNDTEPPIELARIGWGFGRAFANLNLHAQLAPGVRLQLTSYLSSRHHEDTWVKDGYVQIDQLPLTLGMLTALWDRFVTLKVGHMEINYGDAHFRRSDGGEGMYNPFVGNLLLDSFTTEIGAEAYLHAGGIFLMGGITGGEIHGDVQNSQNRMPAFLWKAGYDRQVKPDLRIRLTASNYVVRKSPGSTLYFGDRAGSHYWGALESEPWSDVSQAWSGRINPLFRNKVTAYQINPFVKYKGLELFGVIEHAAGLTYPETVNRTWNQYALDTVYRFFEDRLYIGARYNHAEGQLPGIDNRVRVRRFQAGGGWFLIPYLLLKAEFVAQYHHDYPMDHIDYNGHFHGVTISAVLAF